MAFIRLHALSCQETQEAMDEPRLIGILPDPTPTRPYQERSIPIAHPLQMDKGDTHHINQLIEFDAWIRIELWEHDIVGRDDRIGAVTVPAANVGEQQTMLFTGPDLGNGRHASYRIVYDVSPDETFEYPSRIRLVRLHCHDAQERTDEVFLTVNSREVWSHGRMDNGVTAEIDRTEDFRDVVQVELWERDSSRSDLFGALRVDLRSGGVAINEDIQVEFSFSRSRLDDALYALTYRIEIS